MVLYSRFSRFYEELLLFIIYLFVLTVEPLKKVILIGPTPNKDNNITYCTICTSSIVLYNGRKT